MQRRDVLLSVVAAATLGVAARARAASETAGAIGASLNLRPGDGTTTIESKTNFLGSAPVGATVTAEALPVHIGRRSSVWQTRITNEAGKLLALVTQTQLVLQG